MSDLSKLRLLIVDTAGIQSYIFNSNRLRENVGASYLVAAVTGEWALATVREVVGLANNIHTDGTLLDRRIEVDETLRAEVIYAGGGNFAALFPRRANGDCLHAGVVDQGLGIRTGVTGLYSARTLSMGQFLRRSGHGSASGDEAASGDAANVGLAGLGVTVMCNSTACGRFVQRGR